MAPPPFVQGGPARARNLAPRAGSLALSVFLLVCMACGGSSGPSPGPAVAPPALIPVSPFVVVGTTLQFQVKGPVATVLAWSVSPLSGGSIDGHGLFTASGTPGTCTVSAAAAPPSRLVLSTQVEVIPAPLPVTDNPDTLQADGGLAGSPDGSLENRTVIGEHLGLGESSSPSGSLRSRGGFSLDAP